MASRRKGPQAAPAQHADEQPAALQTAPPACMMAPVGEPARCPEPLHVVAHIRDSIVTAPMLDALLAYHTAQRAGLPMWARPDEQPRVEIPIARSPCGRFHLTSRPQFAVQESEQRFKSRRPIVEPAQLLAGPSVRRLDIQTGANKGFRIPYSTHLVAGGVVGELVESDEVRVVEVGDAAKLAFESLDGRGVDRAEGLDGDLLAAGAGGLMDHAHAALAERAGDAVVADDLSRTEHG
jgi:hypothetical protein